MVANVIAGDTQYSKRWEETPTLSFSTPRPNIVVATK